MWRLSLSTVRGRISEGEHILRAYIKCPLIKLQYLEQWRNVACCHPPLSGKTLPPLKIFVSLKKKKRSGTFFCASLQLFATPGAKMVP